MKIITRSVISWQRVTLELKQMSAYLSTCEPNDIVSREYMKNVLYEAFRSQVSKKLGIFSLL